MFAEVKARVPPHKPLGTMLERLAKRVGGRSLSRREASKLYLMYDGQEVPSETTLQELDSTAIADWLDEGADESDVVFILDVHQRG